MLRIRPSRFGIRPGRRRRRVIAAVGRLAAIPGVEAFEVLREVSPKNGYRFGISMEFADSTAYAGYNDHPDHVRFVQERWVPEVADFLEVDYARPCRPAVRCSR